MNLGLCFGTPATTVDEGGLEISECTCHKGYIMLTIDGLRYALTLEQAAGLGRALLECNRIAVTFKPSDWTTR